MGRMIETYMTTREELKACVQIVDLRHAPSAEDVNMYEFLKYYGIPVIVIATKADKIPKGKWDKHLKVVKQTLDMDPEDELILFSSETKKAKMKHGEPLKMISRYENPKRSAFWVLSYSFVPLDKQ